MYLVIIFFGLRSSGYSIMNTESNLYIYKYIDKHKALYNFVYHVVLNYDRE